MEEEAISALQQIEGVNDAVARSMYRLGFRALEELAEATEEELAAIPGLSGPDAATKIKESAELTMERLRQERIQAASNRVEPLTERERMLFVRGVGERTIQLLNEAGYRSAEDIRKEDEDRLAIKTGLGIKKARAIKQGAEHFLANESKLIDAARKVAAKAAKDRESEVPQEALVEAHEAPAEKASLEKSLA
jgi:N utilization substance protein A